MIWNILAIIVGITYIAYNIFVAKMMSAKSMKHKFIDGQCFVGKVCANAFYAPAWVLKGIRALVLATVA